MGKAGPGSSGLRYPTWREDALPAEPGRPTSRSGPPAFHSRRAAAVVLAVWIALVAMEAAPHLVHHLFDDDDQASQCEFLALADHTPGALAPSPDLPVLAEATEPPALHIQGALPGVPLSPSSPAPRPSLAPRSSSRSSLRVHLMKRADSASASARGRRGHETCIRVRGRLSGRADRRRAGRGPRAGRQALLPGHPHHRGPVRRGRAVLAVGLSHQGTRGHGDDARR